MTEALQTGLPLAVGSNDGLGVTGAGVMHRGAEFSPCRRYRYALLRAWKPEAGFAMFVGLNPSTADEATDDPTIRRCVAFARAWGYGALCMMNLFAYRATQPADMLGQDDPVGPENNEYLLRMALQAEVVVAAWGVHGTHGGRHNVVRALLPGLHYLRLTKDGHPGHPLYLPATLRPVAWVTS